MCYRHTVYGYRMLGIGVAWVVTHLRNDAQWLGHVVLVAVRVVISAVHSGEVSSEWVMGGKPTFADRLHYGLL